MFTVQTLSAALTAPPARLAEKHACVCGAAMMHMRAADGKRQDCAPSAVTMLSNLHHRP